MDNYDEAARKLRQQITDQDVITSVTFVTMAQNDLLDETTIVEHKNLFVVWDENWRGKRGDIVNDEDFLYKSIHDVTDAGQNRKPNEKPSMWTPLGTPGDEWPDWSQPLGSHDAYNIHDQVTFDGKHYISNTDGNVWQPGVYGWDLAV